LNPSLAFVYRNWQHLSFVLIPFYYYSLNISSLSGQHFFFFSSSCLWYSWMSSVSVWKPKQINKNRKISFLQPTIKTMEKRKTKYYTFWPSGRRQTLLTRLFLFFFSVRCLVINIIYFLIRQNTKLDRFSFLFRLCCVTLDVVASWQCLIILNERRVYFLNNHSYSNSRHKA
jgi:hypothetical protein